MSQDYKFKFDEMRDNIPGTGHVSDGSYASDGHSRNICFTWPDKRMKFLNYAYLVSGEYEPEGIIKLLFTTHTVTMTGINLAPLFQEFQSQRIKQVSVVDKRYNATAEGYAVNNIEIQER